MRDEQWITVTPTDYRHEAEAFRQIAAAIPDDEVYWAWSNFMFSADSGHFNEVDALVLGPGGLYMIEVKSWKGRLALSRGRWSRHGVEISDEVHRVDMKARQFGGLLDRLTRKRGIPRPYVKGAVYFSNPKLEVALPQDRRKRLYGRPRGLPDIAGLVTAPPDERSPRIDARRAKELVALVHEIGLNESHRYRQAGMWLLEPEPFETTRTWQDHLATHQRMRTLRRRVRIYLVERQASAEHRERVARAAHRELAALEGVDHPGIVRADSLEDHPGGPALVYRHDPHSRRLPDYLATYGDRLPVRARTALVRQLAEALAHAHGQRLHHQGLSVSSVLVAPAGQAAGLTEEERWLSPELVITDWVSASRERLLPDDASVHGTRHDTFHQADLADAYLAPEWRHRGADPVALDVFGAGAVAYTVLTGEPPAENGIDLLRKLSAESGLCPSEVRGGLPATADALVRATTAGQPAARPASMAAFLDMLGDVERELAAGAPRPASAEPAGTDPLDAGPGDQVGEWTVEERLGTGSTARAFLARHTDGGRHVLKVALSDEKARLLAQEAKVLLGLRHDSGVIQLAKPGIVDLAGRSALVFEYISRDTLAGVLRHRGRLGADELQSFGDQLFHVVGFLEREGVHHRDLKPGNIVVRTAPGGARTPVLFDFSLSGVSPRDLRAGTDGYLDPFLGLDGRLSYDDAAERYALAVTLHQMASGRLPVWGDGRTVPMFSPGPATIAAEAFEPALRTALKGFFARALTPDAGARFRSLGDMRLAWADVFRTSPGPVAPAKTPPPRPAKAPAAAATKAAPAPKATAKKATATKTAATKTASARTPAAKTATTKATATKTAAPKTATTKATATKTPAPKTAKTAAPKTAAAKAAAPKPAAKAKAGPEKAAQPAPPTAAEIKQVEQALRDRLRNKPSLPLPTVGDVIKETVPRLHNYPGSKNLTAFINKHLTGFVHLPGAGGGKLQLTAAEKSANLPTVRPPTEAEVARARDALWKAFESEKRLDMSAVGQLIRRSIPRMGQPSWGGPKNVTRFVDQYLTEFTITPGEGGGFIHRPRGPWARNMIVDLARRFRTSFTDLDQ